MRGAPQEADAPPSHVDYNRLQGRLGKSPLLAGIAVIMVVIRLASALQVALEIEGLVVQALRVALVHDVAVALVGVRVELVVHERVGARDEQDGLPAAHLADFRRVDEVAPLYLQVLRCRACLPCTLPVGHLVDGLLANHLRDFLVGGVRLAAEEQGGVAAVHDGLRLLVVLRFELGHGLQDDGDTDVAGARDGDGLLNLRDGPDVRELVEDEMNRCRQLAAVVGQRLSAELVDALPHHDGEQEGERLVGIREDAEDRHLRVRVAQRVKLHLIVFEKAAHTGGGDRGQAHVAGDDDGLEGLARRDLEVLVVHQREVLIGRKTAAVGGTHAIGVALEVGRLPRPVRVSGRVARPEAAGEAGDAHRRRGSAALVRDVALALLDLEEEQVERGLEVLIVLAGLGHGEQRQQARKVVVLRREPVAQEGDEGGVQHLLGVLPEGVTRLSVAVGVHDVAVDERQDVGVRLHILERVVVHRLIEVDGVEGLHLVPVVREQEPSVLEERALGVGDEVARVELADVRSDVVERLAGARAAHD